MSGTSSAVGLGSSPNAIATSSGALPYTPARSPIHSTSAVTISSTSTGAARNASYVRWKRYFRNVPYMPGKADENSTAVATIAGADVLLVVEPADRA